MIPRPPAPAKTKTSPDRTVGGFRFAGACARSFASRDRRQLRCRRRGAARALSARTAQSARRVYEGRGTRSRSARSADSTARTQTAAPRGRCGGIRRRNSEPHPGRARPYGRARCAAPKARRNAGGRGYPPALRRYSLWFYASYSSIYRTNASVARRVPRTARMPSSFSFANVQYESS